jgi:hypothetical protein
MSVPCGESMACVSFQSLILSHASIAYAYTTRYLSTSPLSSIKTDDQDFQEALRIISQLVPALTDQKSKVLHSSLDDVVTDVWSRFEPVRFPMTHSTLLF